FSRDWRSDVCSSDLELAAAAGAEMRTFGGDALGAGLLPGERFGAVAGYAGGDHLAGQGEGHEDARAVMERDAFAPVAQGVDGQGDRKGVVEGATGVP